MGYPAYGNPRLTGEAGGSRIKDMVDKLTNTPDRKTVTVKVSRQARTWLMHIKAETGKPIHETIDSLIKDERTRQVTNLFIDLIQDETP